MAWAKQPVGKGLGEVDRKLSGLGLYLQHQAHDTASPKLLPCLMNFSSGLLDSGQPDSVGRRDLEVPVQKVRGDAIAMAAVGGHRHATLTRKRVNSVLFHELGDQLAGDAVAAISQFGMDPRCAVALFALFED